MTADDYENFLETY